MTATTETPTVPAADRNRDQPSRKKWGLIILALLTVGLGFALWRVIAGRGAQESEGPQAFPVKVQRLASASLEDSSEFIGTLDSQSGVSLQPEANGRIVQIFVASGDAVVAGEPIMQLSPDGTQSDYNAALSNITAASAARDAAEAQLRAALERQAQLEADLSLQASDYARTEALVEQGALAEDQLDQVVRDRSVAQAALSSAEQEIQALVASRDQAIATLEQANANAASVQERLADKTVTAPISGIVGDIPIKLGDYVTPGSPLATITQNADLDLEISVPVDEASRLRVGLPVELMLFGSDNVVSTGNIRFVSPTTQANTQTVLAKARFSAPRQRLQDDQRLEVRVVWDERPGVLIPTTAISRMGGETFVFVPGEPEPPAEGEEAAPPPNEDAQAGPPPVVARLVAVELGGLQGNNYQVLEGLEVGDTVITSGLLNLRDGVPIDPQPEQAARGTPADSNTSFDSSTPFDSSTQSSRLQDNPSQNSSTSDSQR